MTLVNIRRPEIRRAVATLSLMTTLAVGAAPAAPAVPAATAALAAPAAPAAYPWRMEQVAPGVFAALQPAERRFEESNATVILGANEVVVIDAQADPAAVHGLIDWIGSQTDAPVRLVINTHWHGDHTQGNAIYRDVYGDRLEILGHASLVQDVPARAAAFVNERIAYFDAELPGAYERLEQGVFRDGSAMTDVDREEQRAVLAGAEAWLAANRGARFLPPDRTYDSRQRLRRAGRTIDLIHAVGHTRGDTVVWLPDDGVAITGDLVDDLPYIGHGYPAAWRDALVALSELPIDTIVPGHGPLFRGTQRIETIRGFLDALVTEVKQGRDDGLDLAAVTQAVRLDSWRDRLAIDSTAVRFFDETLPEAIERAWTELNAPVR